MIVWVKCIIIFFVSSMKKKSRQKKRLNCLFSTYENYTNFASSSSRIENFNLCSLYEISFVECLELKSNYSSHFTRKLTNKAKFSIRKWKDIFAHTLIINKMTEQIDCQWRNTLLMHSHQSLFKYSCFLLIMNLNSEWVSTSNSRRKVQHENEFNESKNKKSSQRWKKSENLLRHTWKKINKIKLHMLKNINQKHQIIKLMIKYDYLLRTFKSINF